MVQRRGARHVCNRQGNRSSVDSMLDTLKWKSLQHRRRDARLHMLYKTHHEDVAISKEERLIPPKRTTRNMHPLSFQVPSSSSDYRKYSFFPRTIRDWNSLPTNTAAATTLVAFKAQVRDRPFNLQGGYQVRIQDLWLGGVSRRGVWGPLKVPRWSKVEPW